MRKESDCYFPFPFHPVAVLRGGCTIDKCCSLGTERPWFLKWASWDYQWRSEKGRLWKEVVCGRMEVWGVTTPPTAPKPHPWVPTTFTTAEATKQVSEKGGWAKSPFTFTAPIYWNWSEASVDSLICFRPNFAPPATPFQSYGQARLKNGSIPRYGTVLYLDLSNRTRRWT